MDRSESSPLMISIWYGLGGCSLSMVLFAPLLFSALALLILFFIVPLAFFMGMPFPVGILHLEGSYLETILWAWCANACASVVGSILTIFIGLSFCLSFCPLLASGACMADLLTITVPRLYYGRIAWWSSALDCSWQIQYFRIFFQSHF